MKIHHDTPYSIEREKGNGGNGPVRSSGVHVSGIIRHLAMKHGMLKKEQGEETTAAPTAAATFKREMYFAVGYAWENYCASFIPGLIHQPGEMNLDGVTMSPDGLTLDELGFVLHEFKATYTSMTHPIQERFMWLWQCMSYLAGLSAKYNAKCTRAVLHPLYMNGDYRENRHPVYRPVMIEFEWGEIEKNWELMLTYKDCARPEEHGL